MPTTLYDKVLAVFGMLRNSINQKTSKIDLAPLFNASVGYPVDSLVIYENVLYRCTTAHQGDWNTADFATATIQDILALKAKKSDLASEFNEETIYSKYQLVFKDGEFSQCTIPGVGSNAVFQRITVADLIARIEQEITQGVALDAIYKAVQNIAPAYEKWKNYKAKDICTYKGVLYECKAEVSSENDDPDKTWWDTYWKVTTVDAVLKSQYIQNGGNATLNTLVFKSEYRKLEISADSIISTRLSNGQEGPEERIFLNVSKSGTVSLLKDLAPEYEDLTENGVVKKFEAGNIVTHGNGLYLCKETHESDIFLDSMWTECTIDAVIDGLMDALSKVHADVVSLGEDVASLGGQVLVGNNGTGVGVSTTGILPDYGGMDYVRRIFFVPSQMSVPNIIGLSVLNGKRELVDNANYYNIWFKPVLFGLKVNDYITTVSFVTNKSNKKGGTTYAYLRNGANKVIGISENSANWSDENNSEITYTFIPIEDISDSSPSIGVEVEDPNDYYRITFDDEKKNAPSNNIVVGMRILKQVGNSFNPMMYVNKSSNSTSSKHSYSPYMTINGVGATVGSYKIHICECKEDFTTADIGPDVKGNVVASITPDLNLSWPPYNSATSRRYVLKDAVTFTHPNKVHFIAFDTNTKEYDENAEFSDGEYLPIGVVRNSSDRQYTCPTDNFVLQTDGHACPRVSFIRAIPFSSSRRKMTYYYDSADYSNASSISLPSTVSDEVEIRILVHGCGESRTLGVGSKTGRLAIMGDSSWLNSGENGVYTINIEAYTTIMLVFKSMGTVVVNKWSNFTLEPLNLWTVERQVLI